MVIPDQINSPSNLLSCLCYGVSLGTGQAYGNIFPNLQQMDRRRSSVSSSSVFTW